MSAVEMLTVLMDKARSLTGLTEKISVPRLTGLMDHFDLHINPNLLSATTFTSPKGGMWSSANLGIVKPGTYTISWCARTNGKNKFVRIRPLGTVNNIAYSKLFVGDIFPLTSSKQSYTFSVPEGVEDCVLFMIGSKGKKDPTDLTSEDVPVDEDVIFYDCKLEVGDLATPPQKVGGVAKALLCALHPVRGCVA